MTHTKHTLLCIDSIDIPTQSWTVTLCFKDLLPFTFVIWECMHKCLIRLDPMFFCPDIGTMCIPKLWTVMYFINFPRNYNTHSWWTSMTGNFLYHNTPRQRQSSMLRWKYLDKTPTKQRRLGWLYIELLYPRPTNKYKDVVHI